MRGGIGLSLLTTIVLVAGLIAGSLALRNRQLLEKKADTGCSQYGTQQQCQDVPGCRWETSTTTQACSGSPPCQNAACQIQNTTATCNVSWDENTCWSHSGCTFTDTQVSCAGKTESQCLANVFCTAQYTTSTQTCSGSPPCQSSSCTTVNTTAACSASWDENTCWSHSGCTFNEMRRYCSELNEANCTTNTFCTANYSSVACGFVNGVCPSGCTYTPSRNQSCGGRYGCSTITDPDECTYTGCTWTPSRPASCTGTRQTYAGCGGGSWVESTSCAGSYVTGQRCDGTYQIRTYQSCSGTYTESTSCSGSYVTGQVCTGTYPVTVGQCNGTPYVPPTLTPIPSPTPECSQGQTKCSGGVRYGCVNGEWNPMTDPAECAPTSTPRPTSTPPASPTSTKTPTSTPTRTPTPSPSLRASPTATVTLRPTATFTPRPTSTLKPTSTLTPRPTATATTRPTQTPTRRPSPTPTLIPIGGRCTSNVQCSSRYCGCLLSNPNCAPNYICVSSPYVSPTRTPIPTKTRTPTPTRRVTPTPSLRPSPTSGYTNGAVCRSQGRKCVEHTVFCVPHERTVGQYKQDQSDCNAVPPGTQQATRWCIPQGVDCFPWCTPGESFCVEATAVDPPFAYQYTCDQSGTDWSIVHCGNPSRCTSDFTRCSPLSPTQTPSPTRTPTRPPYCSIFSYIRCGFRCTPTIDGGICQSQIIPTLTPTPSHAQSPMPSPTPTLIPIGGRCTSNVQCNSRYCGCLLSNPNCAPNYICVSSPYVSPTRTPSPYPACPSGQTCTGLNYWEDQTCEEAGRYPGRSGPCTDPGDPLRRTGFCCGVLLSIPTPAATIPLSPTNTLTPTPKPPYCSLLNRILCGGRCWPTSDGGACRPPECSIGQTTCSNLMGDMGTEYYICNPLTLEWIPRPCPSGTSCNPGQISCLPYPTRTPTPTTGVSSFLADSLVLTTSGPRPIEEIKTGDRVLSFQTSDGVARIGTVSRLFERTSDHFYRIVLANNATIRVTERHPIYLGPDLGFREVRWLQRGDAIFGKSDVSFSADQLRPILITSIERIAGEVRVYNLEVFPFETYLVDGIGVHNKRTVPSATPTSRSSMIPRMSPTPTVRYTYGIECEKSGGACITSPGLDFCLPRSRDTIWYTQYGPTDCNSVPQNVDFEFRWCIPRTFDCTEERCVPGETYCNQRKFFGKPYAARFTCDASGTRWNYMACGEGTSCNAEFTDCAMVRPTPTPIPTPALPRCLGVCWASKGGANCLIYQMGTSVKFNTPMSCLYRECRQHWFFAACDGPPLP